MVTTRSRSQVTESSSLPVRSRSPGRISGRSAKRSGSKDSLEGTPDNKKARTGGREGESQLVQPTDVSTTILKGKGISEAQTTTESLVQHTKLQEASSADPLKEQPTGTLTSRGGESTLLALSIRHELVETKATPPRGFVNVLKVRGVGVPATDSVHQLQNSRIATRESLAQEGATTSIPEAKALAPHDIALSHSTEGGDKFPGDLPTVRYSGEKYPGSTRPEQTDEHYAAHEHAYDLDVLARDASILKTLPSRRNAAKARPLLHTNRYLSHQRTRPRPQTSLSQYRQSILQCHRRKAQWSGQRTKFVAIDTK
jgi:hypothetical protein